MKLLTIETLMCDGRYFNPFEVYRSWRGKKHYFTSDIINELCRLWRYV